MNHHDFPPSFVSPFVNAHGTVRSLDVSGAGEKVGRVGERGDLGWGEVWGLGGEGGRGGCAGLVVGHGCCGGEMRFGLGWWVCEGG